MTDPKPDESRERLWAIAGRWQTSGHVIAEPPVPIRGTDVYEILDGVTSWSITST